MRADAILHLWKNVQRLNDSQQEHTGISPLLSHIIHEGKRSSFSHFCNSLGILTASKGEKVFLRSKRSSFHFQRLSLPLGLLGFRLSCRRWKGKKIKIKQQFLQGSFLGVGGGASCCLFVLERRAPGSPLVW